MLFATKLHLAFLVEVDSGLRVGEYLEWSMVNDMHCRPPTIIASELLYLTPLICHIIVKNGLTMTVVIVSYCAGNLN